MSRAVGVFLIAWLAMAGVLAVAPRAASVSVSYTVGYDMCVTYTIDGTPFGSPWSIRASSPFLAAVSDPTLTGIYYGPTVGSEHAGTTHQPFYDNFYSACNICQAGPLTVTFTVQGRITPDDALPYHNPQYAPVVEGPSLPGYRSQCGGGMLIPELDTFTISLRPVVGPIMIIVSILAIVVVALPIPARPIVPKPGIPGMTPTPGRWGPGMPYYTVEPASPPPPASLAPPVEAGGQPVGGVGLHYGPPYVPPPPTPPTHGTWLRPTCPRCGNLTVPFHDSWFCPVDQWFPWG